jgi:hypothetical protein
LGCLRRDSWSSPGSNSTDIKKLEIQVFCGLADDLGFANVFLSPDVEGHTLAHKREKRFKE